MIGKAVPPVDQFPINGRAPWVIGNWVSGSKLEKKEGSSIGITATASRSVFVM
jgi:hypothetical protein